MLENYLAWNKELWMAFVDLDQAFDRVVREVVWWALRCLDVDEWILSLIKAMYLGCYLLTFGSKWDRKQSL